MLLSMQRGGKGTIAVGWQHCLLILHCNGNHSPIPTLPRPAVLLAAHVALGGMLGAGLGAFDTSFWLTLSTR